MTVTTHRKFLKAYTKLRVEQQLAIDDALLKFGGNRLDPSLQDHALKGKMKALRAFSAGFDLRVIYREEGGFITVVLLDVGTHNQIY
jgi:mRNA-degrading endonuclease YafQ of YafQ-DinJ toxin-antitoxin module